MKSLYCQFGTKTVLKVLELLIKHFGQKQIATQLMTNELNKYILFTANLKTSYIIMVGGKNNLVKANNQTFPVTVF